MKEQLLLLWKLQTIDSRTHETRQAITSLPEKLKPAQRDLERLEEMLKGERDKVAETEAWKTEQEELIKREEEAVKAAKAKLAQAKNAKDFAAASREVDNKRRSISEREDEVLKVGEAMETTKAALESKATDVESLRESLDKEASEIASKVSELEEKVRVESSGRDELVAALPKNVVKKYETVLAKRGVAVVPVKAGVCQGCHMRLPPQLNNLLARFESIETCPTCQRILYREELTADLEAEQAGANES